MSVAIWPFVVLNKWKWNEAVHILYNSQEGGTGLTICYKRCIREGGLSLLMLYNVIHLRIALHECFIWRSRPGKVSKADAAYFVGDCHRLKTITILMTVLHLLMTVFSYSMFYRLNCIMFTFSIGSFLWNEAHGDGGELGQCTGVIQGGDRGDDPPPKKILGGGRHSPYPPNKLSAQLRKITICLDNRMKCNFYR